MTASHQPTIIETTTETFADRLHRALQGRRDSNGKISKEVWFETVNEMFQIEKAKKLRKPKGTPRARNPLWDTLASACGMNLNEITRVPAKMVGVALADILAASPDVTPDEIRRRIEGYRRKYPTAALSPFALANHWSEFGVSNAPGSTTRSIYNEPEPGWREKATARWPDAKEWINPHDFATIAWFDISNSIRTDILKLL